MAISERTIIGDIEGRCGICGYRTVEDRERPGRYLHCLPEPVRPEGIVVDSPQWRAAMQEWGSELGLYTLRTGTHRAVRVAA